MSNFQNELKNDKKEKKVNMTEVKMWKICRDFAISDTLVK